MSEGRGRYATSPRHSAAHGLAIAVCVAGALAAACTPLHRPARRPPVGTPDAVLGALAARERAMMDARVSMSVRGNGAGASSVFASPAYLAVDGPERLRLQIVSMFGMTVFDLTIDGDDYVLSMPLRGEVRRGRIDLGAFGAATTPAPERMIVALALLFRPKIGAGRCHVAAAHDLPLGAQSRVTCGLGADLVATVVVDDQLRPTQETFARAEGDALLVAEYTDYDDPGPTSFPGRITIRDPASDAGMIIRVLRVRHGAPANPS